MANITGAWETDLAGLMKKNTGEQLGITLGHVVGTSPLSISIMGGDIIIQSDIHEIFVCKSFGDEIVYDYEIDKSENTTTIENVDKDFDSEGEIVLSCELEEGDMVIVLPDMSQKAFFITNKLEKVGG